MVRRQDFPRLARAIPIAARVSAPSCACLTVQAPRPGFARPWGWTHVNDGRDLKPFIDPRATVDIATSGNRVGKKRNGLLDRQHHLGVVLDPLRVVENVAVRSATSSVSETTNAIAAVGSHVVSFGRRAGSLFGEDGHQLLGLILVRCGFILYVVTKAYCPFVGRGELFFNSRVRAWVRQNTSLAQRADFTARTSAR